MSAFYKSGLILLIFCLGCSSNDNKKTTKSINPKPVNGFRLDTRLCSIIFPTPFDTIRSVDSLSISYVSKNDSMEIVLSEMLLQDSLIIEDSSKTLDILTEIKNRLDKGMLGINWHRFTHSTPNKHAFEGNMYGTTSKNKHLFCKILFQNNMLLNLTIKTDSMHVDIAQATINSLGVKN